MTVVKIPAASLPCHPSSPLWCHPSSPDYLDPGKLIVHYSNIFDQKLDSSVKHWNDTLPMGTALKLQQHE
ncbi:hypothetical protein [Wolbachia endosymbiont of Liriomyza huidobrensis]|uniref:hypothetical protein n=1 Tax=Wolbachia endosymbiont of Liriomyza huidobrensis TaxID=2867522 RepID=UPI0036F2E54F